MPQFGKGHDAEKDVVLSDLCQPFDDTRSGARLGPLGEDVRIEQIAHRSVGRSRSLERWILKREVKDEAHRAELRGFFAESVFVRKAKHTCVLLQHVGYQERNSVAATARDEPIK